MISQQTQLYQWSYFLSAATDERAATDENDVMVMMCAMLVLFKIEREREREREADHLMNTWFKYQVVF